MKNKHELLETLAAIKRLIGQTPVIQLKKGHTNLFAKLEYQNYSGSIKDRAVNEILYQGILSGQIGAGTTIIESSSGNFAISAALHCQRLGLKFIAVVDPNINKINLKILEIIASEVVMVKAVDETGGYLLNRIETVKQLLVSIPDSYWTNQYENENNYRGYFGLAEEIRLSFKQLDYLFVAVSSCGTYRGLSEFLKLGFPDLTVVAIDIEGSQIFSNKKKSRHISGIGASKKSSFIPADAVVENIILGHQEIIDGCMTLLKEYSLFVGGSSGACFAGATNYLKKIDLSAESTSLMVFPDKGFSYLDTIFDNKWVEKIAQKNYAIS